MRGSLACWHCLDSTFWNASLNFVLSNHDSNWNNWKQNDSVHTTSLYQHMGQTEKNTLNFDSIPCVWCTHLVCCCMIYSFSHLLFCRNPHGFYLKKTLATHTTYVQSSTIHYKIVFCPVMKGVTGGSPGISNDTISSLGVIYGTRDIFLRQIKLRLHWPAAR